MSNGLCDSFCRDCYYVLGGLEKMMTCDYFEKADKRRPCPAGKGCTVKITPAQYAAERKRKAKPIMLRTIRCGVCGKEFQTADRRRRNCSPECLEISRHRASRAQADRLKQQRHGDLIVQAEM